MLILGWVAEVYRLSNFLGFQISFILSCQLKKIQINSCIIKKKIIIYSDSKLCNLFFKSTQGF